MGAKEELSELATIMTNAFGCGNKTGRNKIKVNRILKSGDRTIVFWADGEKTIVKRASDEPESDYAAFTAALGIKVYGSNSALKRIVERTETQKPKKKQNNVQADA